MSLRLSAALTTIALLAGCANAPRPTREAATMAAHVATSAVMPADDNLNAVAWSQLAIEHDLVYLQTFRDAQARLFGALHDPQWDALSRHDRVAPLDQLKPAVILDIDETALDNSPYAARVIRGDSGLSDADWSAWCREARARALPGAVAFTRFAQQHGIAVIYLSNRASNLGAVTLANLRQAGFAVSGPEAFLGLGMNVQACKQVGSAKGCRRQWVARRYRVLMQFGDQLADFVDVPDNTAVGRDKVLAPYLAWIGTRWFMLPNPTYGAWESPLVHDDWTAPAAERRRLKMRSLRYR